MGLAEVRAAHGQFEAAEQACRQGIALRPRDWRGYINLGWIYYRQGRFSQAIPPWRRVLKLLPEHPRAASNLAAALFQLDRFEESESGFRRALEIEPSAAAYANLGAVLYSQHRFAEAVTALEHACELRPADARFWGYLGGAARRLENGEERSRDAYDRAIGLMREALERNPEDAQGWAIFSTWLAARGQAAEARAAIERGLALAPGDMRCMIEAVHTYTLLDDLDEAFVQLARAVEAGCGLRSLEQSVELEPLRSDERYRRIVEEARDRRASGATRARQVSAPA
jgi:serine/threonine-protein kinase